MQDLNQLLTRLEAGDTRALARLLSLIESNPHSAGAIEKRIQRDEKVSSRFVIGITGLPGAGKSTLIGMLIEHFLQENRKIGVIAIDPTSPLHGGALLGDRIRLMRYATNPSVLIRSMASRGELGGLSASVPEAISLMAYAGYDPILIESVGMGQIGWDTTKHANVTLTVIAPGLGDDIQLMKSGLSDIVDAIVVNKKDLPGADQTLAAVQNEMEHRQMKFLSCCATTGEGVPEIASFAESRRGNQANQSHSAPAPSRFEAETINEIAALLTPRVIEQLRQSNQHSTPQQAAHAFIGQLLRNDSTGPTPHLQ